MDIAHADEQYREACADDVGISAEDQLRQLPDGDVHHPEGQGRPRRLHVGGGTVQAQRRAQPLLLLIQAKQGRTQTGHRVELSRLSGRVSTAGMVITSSSSNFYPNIIKSIHSKIMPKVNVTGKI